MAKRKRKAISFDAMIKFFIQQYDIPTKKDIARMKTILTEKARLENEKSRGKEREG